MKKILMSLTLIIAIAFTACSIPNSEKLPEEMELTYYPENQEQKIFAKLHKGDGYSIYLDTEGFAYEKKTYDNVTEERWVTNQSIQELAYRIVTYKNTDVEDAIKIFANSEPDYTPANFETSLDIFLEYNNGDIMRNLFGYAHSNGKDTYLVICDCSQEAVEGFGALAISSFDTFRLEN